MPKTPEGYTSADEADVRAHRTCMAGVRAVAWAPPTVAGHDGGAGIAHVTAVSRRVSEANPRCALLIVGYGGGDAANQCVISIVPWSIVRLRHWRVYEQCSILVLCRGLRSPRRSYGSRR